MIFQVSYCLTNQNIWSTDVKTNFKIISRKKFHFIPILTI